jgi:hypothetical protein
VATSVHAQDLSKTIISIELNNASLEEAFHTIEAQTTFRFSYKTGDIADIQGIRYQQRQVPVKKVLTDLLGNTPLQYEQQGNYILITKIKQPSSHHMVILYGFVKSVHSGETLAAASISISGNKTYSSISNAYGFYSITAPAGEYILTCSYIGFRDTEERINLQQTSQHNIALTVKEGDTLQSVIVGAETRKTIVKRVITGYHRLSIEEIRKMPMVGGEPDVLKSLQFLPGIQTSNEGTTNLSVRGGSYDQNLILLDEATVYNPTHTLGFFSAFNTDALKDVSIYKGVYPAQYGGRLSSVIDIRMKEGNSQKQVVTGGIGLLASRLTWEGPFKKDRSSFMISGRYSNIGTLLNLPQVSELYKSYANNNRIEFYDLNAKFNTILGKKDRLYLSAYTGHDNFYMHVLNKSDQMTWGNATFTARWNHVFNAGIFANTSLLFSNYDYSNSSRDDTRNFAWKARLQEITCKTDVDWMINTSNQVKFGAGITWQDVSPGKVVPNESNGASKGVSLNNRRSAQLFAYISNEQKINKHLSLSYGLRATGFAALGDALVYRYNADTTAIIDSTWYSNGKITKSYVNIEPRITAGILLSNTTSLKVSYGRNYQYQHLLSSSSVGLPTDIWLPSDTYFKPQRTDHFAAGMYKTLQNGTWEASMELYYRQSYNIIDFRDNAEVFMNNKIETQILTGKAKGYGLEWLIKKNKGASTGWISYTWSKALRKVNGINNNEWYPPVYDHRHNISVVYNYKVNKRLSFSANWVFRSGGHASVPIGSYIYNDVRFFYYGKRNGYVLPANHRFDLNVAWQSRTKPNKKFQGEWVLSVYNAYNRKNVFALYVSEDYLNNTRVRTTLVYLTGILPSITYNFKF